jgi:hypothetical protein
LDNVHLKNRAINKRNMKTIEQINNRIDTLEKTGNATSDQREKNRCRKELRLARIVKMYLEYKPSEDSVKRQLSEALLKAESINKRFDVAFPSVCTPKKRAEFMNNSGMPEIKKQIEILKYML